jgi:MFS family permease
MGALLAMTMLGFSGYAVLLPVAPLWAVHGGAGSAGAGAVNGVLMLFTVLTQPFVPSVLRRFGRAPVMVVGMVLLGVPAVSHVATDALLPTLALSAARGLGFGVLTVMGSAVLAELVPPSRRGAAIGAYGLAIAVPQLVLLPAGPWLADRRGFWVVFVISGSPLLGCIPAWMLGRRLDRRAGPAEPPDHVPAAHPSRWPVYRGLLRPMVLLLGVTLAGGALITFAPQLIDSPGLTALALFLLTGTAALSRWGVGGLADRHGAHRFLWPLVLLTGVGMAAAAWAARGTTATEVVPLLVGMTVVGVCYGALQNLTLLLALHAVTRRDYPVASAAWNIGFDAGTGLGAVGVGLIASGSSFSVALAVAAAISLSTMPLALVRARRTPSPYRAGDG